MNIKPVKLLSIGLNSILCNAGIRIVSDIKHILLLHQEGVITVEFVVYFGRKKCNRYSGKNTIHP